MDWEANDEKSENKHKNNAVLVVENRFWPFTRDPGTDRGRGHTKMMGELICRIGHRRRRVILT